ncbi:TadE/TadG family type IV pilus assembly protein [Methylobacterium radiodurans]|uniref:Pilus assembly protein TadE n=1 Tax=Methylobacterium radiodurans TaxID=2202828 RepID=A0A2U8VM36_9HYPH|nr:TadE/TadG family type IV pilus assembly protein [Methylobacterium radiodurans]AWN34735.1 pilus assembly protein TadE [Methylobacterium radiodurans]
MIKRDLYSTVIKPFGSAREGAAAVEFALVAVPFLGLCAAIIQVAFLIWAAQNFDRALQVGVRSLFTGQFQLSNAGQTDPTAILTALRSQICGAGSDNRVTLFDCSAVKLDVKTAGSFGSSAPASPVDPNTGTWSTSFGNTYVCPKPGAIVVVTAAVKLPTLLGLLGTNFRTFADGSYLLMSTAVFRTEPYQTTGTTACAS